MMDNELDRLLNNYSEQCILFPGTENVKYLYVDRNGWLGIFNTTDTSTIRHAHGFYRYPIYSEDDLVALVSMLEL